MKIYYPKKQVHTFWNPKYYLIKTSSTADMINNELKKKNQSKHGLWENDHACNHGRSPRINTYRST